MEEISNPPLINFGELLQIIDSEISNTISLSESLKVDSLALIATVLALIGIIGISAIKELLLIWVASSFLLITLIFLKIIIDFFPFGKKQKNFENVFSGIGEKKRNILFLQMMGAIFLNNFKPLYKSIILIFFTDLLIFFVSSTDLLIVPNLGFPILISIIAVLIILTVFSLNLAKFGAYSMGIVGNLSYADMEKKSDQGKKFINTSAKISFIGLLFPLAFLIIILLKINDVIPFLNNFSNFCKISILMIIQVIFIAIFCEFFNKQMVSQILSKKILLLNSLKLLIFSRDDDIDKKITHNDIKYLFKSCNLFVIQKDPSFFFFENNSVQLNLGTVKPALEDDLKKLLNDELNFYLTP